MATVLIRRQWRSTFQVPEFPGARSATPADGPSKVRAKVVCRLLKRKLDSLDSG